MGWLFSSEWARKQNLVDHLLSQVKEPYFVIAHRVVGNHLWVLYGAQPGTDAWHRMEGKNEIVLYLMQFSQGEGGYKGIGENCGPYHMDCPMSLIKLAGPPITDTAQQWRDHVLQSHAQTKELRNVKIEPGDLITYGNVQYRAEKCVGRRGWHVTRVSDGFPFRMTARQMNQVRKRNLAEQQDQAAHNEQNDAQVEHATSQCELWV